MSKRCKFTIRDYREMMGFLKEYRDYASRGLENHANHAWRDFDTKYLALSAITHTYPSLCTEALIRRMKTAVLSDHK